MRRRRFLSRTVPALAGGTAVTHAPQVIAAPKIRWRMPTAFPATLDVIHGSAHRLADLVSNMSGGQFQIEVFAAGEIVPALGVFEACSKGTVEAFMGAS